MSLYERETQLQGLHDAYRRVATGGGEMVFLSGEAGIGKTSLIEQFLREIPGDVSSAVVSCDGLGVPGPFGALFDIADALGPEVLALLEDQAPREEIFRAVLRAFRQVSGTMVMVGEDAHWIDEATLEMVRFLGRRIRSTRVLFIVDYRDDHLGPYHPLRRALGDLVNAPGVSRMTLPPLSREAVRAMAEGTGLDPDEIYELTGGNPFFVSETLEAGHAGVPASVQDAVLSRASRLTPEARAVLDAAAAIGMTADPALLAAVIGAPIDSAVEECLAVGILRPNDKVVEFRHGLSRKAIRESLSAPRRRALHRRILEAMQAGTVDERDLAHLAYHAEKAGDREAVLTYAVRAARRAARFGSHREAVAHFARAVRMAEGMPPIDLASLMEAWSYECYLTGDLEEATRIAEDVVRLHREAGDRLKQGDATRWLSRLAWFSGKVELAHDLAGEAYEILSCLPPGRELAMAMSSISQLRMLEQDGSAIELGERAIELATSFGADDIRAHAMVNVGTARFARGEAAGKAELEVAFALARDIGQDDDAARALTNLAWTAYVHRDLVTAERALERAIEFSSERDLIAMELYQRAILASAWLARGRFAEARLEAERLAWMPTAIRPTRLVALVCLGRALGLTGDDGTTVLREVYDLAMSMGELQRLGPMISAIAEAAWLRGNLDAVVDDVRPVLDLAKTRGDVWVAGELALWLHRAGEPVDVFGLPDVYALEIAGNGEDAANAWEEMGYPLEAIRARASIGTEERLRDSIEAFRALGAVADEARIARELRAMGARNIPRGPRPETRANAAHLTAREIDVLALLADGVTNREIADRLFLSVKTAGHHVSSILAKLEVSSRREAVGRAEEMGILARRDRDTAVTK